MKRRALAVVFALFVVASGCGGDNAGTGGPQTPEEARQALYDRGIHMSMTTFRQAVARNDREALELFFAAGQDPNERGDHNATALGSANSVETARMLIEHGADVNAKDRFGGTPLWSAVEQDNADLAGFYLEQGADPNAEKPEDGLYPIMRAAARGNRRLLTLLLDHGAYTDVRDNRGWTAGMYATFTDHDDLLQLLIDRANPQSLRAEPAEVDFTQFGYADREAFEDTYRIDFLLEEEPARQPLIDFCNALNLELTGPPSLMERLDRPISVDVAGLSRLEAIERICARLDLHPDYEESDDEGERSVARLEEGERRFPAAFTGPFMVAVTNYYWAQPALKLSVYGFGLPYAQVAKAEEDLVYVEEIVEADGPDLITKRERAQPKDPFGKDAQAIVVETEVGLDDALGETATTVDVRGTINAALLAQTESARLTTIEEGASISVGGMEFTLTGLPEPDSRSIPSIEFTVNGAGETFGPGRYTLTAFDSDGNEMPTSGGGYAKVMDEDPIVTLNIQQVPAAVEIEVVKDAGKIAFPFELNDVVLAKR